MTKVQVVLTAVAMAMSSPALLRAQEATAHRPQGRPGETPEQRDARMKWWRDARFGMFIHWGLYAVPAGTYQGRQIPGIGEWIMLRGRIPVAEYAAHTKQFNPTKYEPDAWVRLAKDAGMKYIVITSKHHDGFALFDSKASDFDVVDATPYGKDLLKPLAEACRTHGMKLGFYYSQAQDWHHPGGAAAQGGHWDPAQDGDMTQYIKNIAVPQVREILSNYGDVAVLWWDTPTDMTLERAKLLEPLIGLQPNIITNNRLGAGIPGDTETPEQYIPATGFPGRDFEVCMTMNDTWGFKSYDHNWKSTETLIRNLVDIASKGGNYLLNVGPTAEGEIPQPSVERLQQIGQWMQKYGQSIYGTTASPFKKYSFDGRCTVKGGRMYVHVFKWPAEGVRLTGLKTAVKSGRFIDGGEAATIEQGTASAPGGGDATLPAPTIKPPAKPDPLATVVELELDGKPEVDPTTYAIRPEPDGTLRLRAADALIMGRRVKLEETPDGVIIGNWIDRRDFVMWDVLVPKAGQYAVEMNYACPDAWAGSQVQLAVDDETNQSASLAAISGTGGLERYEDRSVGTVTLPQGSHTLKLRPTTMPTTSPATRSTTATTAPATLPTNVVMNLKEVRLKPAK